MPLSSIGIEPKKAWHDVIDRDSFINLFIYVSCFPFTNPFAFIGYLSIHAHITCIAHGLGALGEA